MANRKVAVGVFGTRAAATDAVRELRGMGFRDDQIGVMGRNHADTANDSGLENDPTGTRWEEGTGIGAAAGAATGTGLGLAVAAGLIPGVGPIIAGGTLVALLASAGAGATVGTVLGGLVGLGVPEEEATAYQTELDSGRVLVTVDTGEAHYDQAEAVLRRHGGRTNPSAVTAAG